MTRKIEIIDPSDWGSVCRWFARILVQHVKIPDCEVVLLDKPTYTAAVTFWPGWYSNRDIPRKGTNAASLHHFEMAPSAAWLTHIGPAYTFNAPELLMNYDYLISSSHYWRDFVIKHLDWPEDRIRVAYPGADNYPLGETKKITVGIAGEVYTNGRKREWIITEAFWKIGLEDGLSNMRFHFLGNSWSKIVKQLRMLGVECIETKGTDYDGYAKIMPTWDYLLSTGFAEGGPMSVIRALRSGIRVIASPTGVAADFNRHCILFDTADELANIFKIIQPPVNSPAFPWSDFIRVHREVFEEMMAWPSA